MPTPITASTLSALLSAALAQKPTRPLVLALDGRCGSGKTTLANALAAQLPCCTLLRTDDFYLPPARRSPDWAHTPCANMDLTRLRDEALRPAYAGQPVAYRAYSCREGGLSAPGTAARAAAGDFRGQLQPPPAAAPLRDAAGVRDLHQGRADPALTGAGGRTLRGFCRPVGAAGGGVLCAVWRCRKRGFCGGHHPRRDDLECAPRCSAHK